LNAPMSAPWEFNRAGGFIAHFRLACIGRPFIGSVPATASFESTVGTGMELAFAIKEVSARGALTVVSRQLLFLIALGYGISYLVPAGIGIASPQVNDEEPRSGGFVHGSRFELRAQLVCGSAPPRFWERSACNLPK
jgi:hypothetical protein